MSRKARFQKKFFRIYRSKVYNDHCVNKHGDYSVLARDFDHGSFSSVDLVKWKERGRCRRNISALKIFSVSSLRRQQCAVYECLGSVRLETGLDQLRREIQILESLRENCEYIVKLEKSLECSSCKHMFVSLAFGGRPIMFFRDQSFYEAWTIPNQSGMLFARPSSVDPSTRSVLREADVVTCLKQLTRALLFLKGQQIIHKDIKPANVLLNYPLCSWRELGSSFACREVSSEFNHERPMHVTLCDFNIAEKREGGRIFDAQGTVLFSPPEVFGRIDPHIGVDGFQRDVWSMGVLAYCLITGETPVQESDSSLMTQIEIVRLRSESRHLQLPPFVENHQLRFLVESLLDPDPERRVTVERCEQQLQFM